MEKELTEIEQTNTAEEWDMVITPHKKWYDLQLREVWHYRDLISLFVRRDFVSRYKQTILGPLWFIIQPLLTSLVFTVIFGNIAQLPTDGLPQMLFYMSGNILWHYFSSCLTSTSTTFTSNAHLFGKVYFPRLVTPISIVISNLITFAIQFAFFMAYFAFFALRGSEVRVTSWALALPLLIFLMAGLGLGSGFMDDYLKTILPDKLRLDQLYVRNYSIFTDLDVLAMTAVTLLPLLRRTILDQRWLFGGPFYLFFRRVFSWFLIDMFITTFAVGLSGVIWRISAVINLGWQNYLLMSFAIAIFVSLINLILGLNRINWRSASPVYVVDLAVSIGITMVVLYGVTRLWLTEPWLPFSLIWLIGITMFVGLVLVRYRDRLFTGLANRWLLLRGAKSSFAEHVLIVGAGSLAEMTIWLLQRSAYSSVFGIIGMVDDDARKRNMESYGVRVIGTMMDIPDLVEKYQIGLIFFAIANGSEKDRDRITQLCEATDAKIMVIPDLVKVLERSIKKITIQESS